VPSTWQACWRASACRRALVTLMKPIVFPKGCPACKRMSRPVGLFLVPFLFFKHSVATNKNSEQENIAFAGQLPPQMASCCAQYSERGRRAGQARDHREFDAPVRACAPRGRARAADDCLLRPLRRAARAGGGARFFWCFQACLHLVTRSLLLGPDVSSPCAPRCQAGCVGLRIQQAPC
jgi:hypothetical protein